MPGMTSDRQRQVAAATRVRIALDSIDEAQRLIEQAMTGPLRGRCASDLSTRRSLASPFG